MYALEEADEGEEEEEEERRGGLGRGKALRAATRLNSATSVHYN